MKRLVALAALAALVLPASAIAKGPDEATIKGPGLQKAIVVAGPEQDGSPLMDFVQATGLFPAVFGQEPNPMLPGRPKGALGPKYTIDYNVPGGNGENFRLRQDLYPYAKPYAVTNMASGQRIFDSTTRGGWFTDSSLKDRLVILGLPKTAPSATARDSSSAGFFSTGRLGALIVVLFVLGSATIAMRRRFGRDTAA